MASVLAAQSGSLNYGTAPDMVSVLGCDCSGCCETPLDASCVEAVWPGNLGSLYRFSQGINGYYIGDGGRDMYDVGNEVSVRINGQWSGPMYYNQNCDGSNPHPVGGYYKMGGNPDRRSRTRLSAWRSPRRDHCL